MKSRLNENTLVAILFSALLILFLILLFLSKGYAGGADNMTHYRYSRYAFQHPEFFLWHWGKPIFTLLTSPFAQLGFRGVQIFNVLCSLLSAYICYLICKELHIANRVMVIIILCFLPIYTVMLLSGMTEILFSLIAILSSYLFLRNKYILSAIVISFLPLARTEGVFLLPVFGLAYIIYKQYKAIPFLLTGSLLYSFIGWPYYHDFFWLITKMPYNGYKVYGTGPLFYYVITSNKYLGFPVMILGWLGLYTIFRNFFHKEENSTKILLIIFLPFFVYFSAHSLMWWSGLGNSMGAHRYMAGIAPFMAIIALFGFNFLETTFKVNKRNSWVKRTFFVVITGCLIISPFKCYSIPVPYNQAQIVIKSFANWYRSSEYKNSKIYYYHPDIPYFLNLNPYDKSRCHVCVRDNKKPDHYIETGSLILWDSYFSAFDGLKLETLKSDKHLRFIRSFGKNNIMVFEKTDSTKTQP